MPREALLVRTLVELADNLVDDFDVIDLLTHLADRCVEVLDVTAAGVMLATPADDLQVVASSSEAMRILELFELQADEGPCVDCYRTAAAVVNQDLGGVGGRWPHFTPQAAAAGFRSVHAVPMRLRGRTIGALNLFRTGDGVLDDTDVVAAQALADIATIALVQHQAAVDAQVLNAQLTQALDSRVLIEQAKGKVSEASGLDMNEAFHQLRRHARNHNLRLADLARNIADGTVNPRSLDRTPPQTTGGAL
jgi:GAF domain-containing protein